MTPITTNLPNPLTFLMMYICILAPSPEAARSPRLYSDMPSAPAASARGFGPGPAASSSASSLQGNGRRWKTGRGYSEWSCSVRENKHSLCGMSGTKGCMLWKRSQRLQWICHGHEQKVREPQPRTKQGWVS